MTEKHEEKNKCSVCTNALFIAELHQAFCVLALLLQSFDDCLFRNIIVCSVLIIISFKAS